MAKYLNQDLIYKNSNKIETFKGVRISARTKKLYNSLANKPENLCSKDMVELTNLILNDFKTTPIITVVFGGTQPNAVNQRGKLVSKTLGVYMTGLKSITVYKHTAKTKKVVANKTALNVLLHEIMHHIDYEYLKLGGSLHTAGFYKRISWLSDKLKT